MKSSIKFLAIIALFFTFTFTTYAQKGGGNRSMDPEKRAEQETSQMSEKLSLDEAQTFKVSELNLTYAQKMQEVAEDNKGNRDAMKKISAAIQSEKDAEMKLLLTDAQFKTYEEMQAEQANKGPRGRKGGGRKGSGSNK